MIRLAVYDFLLLSMFICFNATSPNALLPCRNQQLGAPSCHKCPLK